MKPMVRNWMKEATHSRRFPIDTVQWIPSSLQLVQGGPYSRTLHRTFLALQP